MKLWRTGTRLCSRARARTSSRLGATGSAAGSAATAIEDLLRVGQAAVAAVEEDRQVVEDVGRLLVDAVVGLLARGPRDLLGLLLDLRADARRVVEELDGVRALRPLALAIGERPFERRERLVRGRRLGLAVVEARPRAGVTGGAGGLDEGEQRVAVAVQPERSDRLDVAGRRALVPELVPRAAPEVQLAGLARLGHRLGVGVGEGEDLSRAPVLHDDRDEAALVVGDLHRAGFWQAGGRVSGRRQGTRARADYRAVTRQAPTRSTRPRDGGGPRMPPRLTRSVFFALAIWMVGLGLLTGVAFPPMVLLLGVAPAGQALTV